MILVKTTYGKIMVSDWRLETSILNSSLCWLSLPSTLRPWRGFCHLDTSALGLKQLIFCSFSLGDSHKTQHSLVWNRDGACVTQSQSTWASIHTSKVLFSKSLNLWQLQECPRYHNHHDHNHYWKLVQKYANLWHYNISIYHRPQLNDRPSVITVIVISVYCNYKAWFRWITHQMIEVLYSGSPYDFTRHL